MEITPEQLDRIYLPVLALMESRAEELRRSDAGGVQRRLLVGLAGIPGGGKSCFAAVLSHVAGRVLPAARLVVVGMDGWHHPNAVLDERLTTDEAGRLVPLRKRKGGPESYDLPALAAALRVLGEGGRAVSLPVYDRRLHDPVADGLVVPADTRIVLVEGNYLLCDSPPWDQVSSLLDLKLYLECDPAIARERIIARHVRGGMSEAEAAGKYEFNDAPNTRAVQASAGRADFVIRLSLLGT